VGGVAQAEGHEEELEWSGNGLLYIVGMDGDLIASSYSVDLREDGIT
jgi:hypothetical protein